MKSASIVILLPLMSVLVLSLYVAGGRMRMAAFALLAASLIAGAGLVMKKSLR
jgi:hypothetical protein